jgi:hypothetical protein
MLVLVSASLVWQRLEQRSRSAANGMAAAGEGGGK